MNEFLLVLWFMLSVFGMGCVQFFTPSVLLNPILSLLMTILSWCFGAWIFFKGMQIAFNVTLF